MEENKQPFTKESFCTRLGFDEKYFYTAFYPYWDEFCENCGCRKPFFAEKSFYTKWHALVNDDAEILKRMEEVEEILENDPAASFFANILHYAFFVREEPYRISNLPESIGLFGENSGIFFLLVAESNFPAIEKAYKELSLPEEYLRGVGKWINGTIKIYKAAHNGIPGHTVTQTSWIGHYSRKTLFRIGRFEFLLHTYIQDVYKRQVETLAEIAHKNGALFHTDAVQAVGKIPIDLKNSAIDMLSLSGHKLHGPKGIGALYVKRGVRFRPYIIGGHQENGRRAGTENVASIIGLGKAAELALQNIEKENTFVASLRDKLEKSILETIPRVRVNGDTAHRLPNTTNISFEYIEGESILMLLDMFGICASSGSACTTGSLEPSHVLRAMGIPYTCAHGAIRFSFSRYNTMEEVDFVLEKLPPVIARLREISPYWEENK